MGLLPDLIRFVLVRNFIFSSLNLVNRVMGKEAGRHVNPVYCDHCHSVQFLPASDIFLNMVNQ